MTPAAAVATAASGVVLGALGGGLTLIFALRCLHRANWARIGLSVMFALSAINLLATPTDFGAPGTGLIDLTAVILLWLPTSNEFFRLVKHDRATHRSRQLT